MGLLIQRSADLYFLPGKPLGLDLIIQPVDVFLHQEHQYASALLGAMESAASSIVAVYALLGHGIVGMAGGVNVIGALAVHYFALEFQHAGLFVFGKGTGRQ